MKNFLKSYKNNLVQQYLLMGLIAVELLMSFSFLGYLHIEPISITFAYIPVLLAGCLLGPGASALVGLVFGLASMWKASATYVSAGDRIFSPILSGEPIASLFLSIGSRVLFGFVVGLLFFWAKKSRRASLFWISLVSFSGRLIHSLFVYAFMGILFPEMGLNVFSTFNSFGSLGNTLTMIVTTVVVLAAYCVRNTTFYRNFEHRMQVVQHLHLMNDRSLRSTVFLVVLTVASVCAIAFYFLHRMDYVLDVSGYHIDDTTYGNLVHLQIQFVLGILSLTFLVGLFLSLVFRYTTYVRYEAESDSLTGLMNRKGFFPLCERLLAEFVPQEGAAGYFMVLDIDHFKHINDSFGHPKGDKVLCHVAKRLQENFSDMGIVGRLGGDEFAVFFYKPCNRKELEKRLNQFMQSVYQIHCITHKVSCSMGIVPVTSSQEIEDLYRQADDYLYQAKNKGKDQFVIGNDRK